MTAAAILAVGVALILAAIPVEATAHTRPREITALTIGWAGSTLATLGAAWAILPALAHAITH